MFFNIFNIDRRIKSALKKNRREPIFHRLEEMKTILIFFHFEDWFEIKNISQELEAMGKKVMLWTIQPDDHTDIQIIFPEKVRLVWKKELSKLWGLSPSVVKEFKGLAYDTLIDLTDAQDKRILHLMASSSADFCIGINEPQYKVYDFIVLRERGKEEETDDNEENGENESKDATLIETFKQIKFYLNNIQSGVNNF